MLAKSKRAEGTSPNILRKGREDEHLFCEIEEEMGGQLRLFPEESSNQ